jgi:ABC-type transporter Mla MlaB component
MTISINHVQKQGLDHVSYSGPLNAASEVYLSQLLPSLGNRIRFSLEHVTEVNSCGVRSWIHFIRSLDQKGAQLTLTECPEAIVLRMNLIPSFRGSAEIESVYGSYFCDECELTEQVLFKVGLNLPEPSSQAHVAEKLCASCGHKMEFSEIEDEYFSFLATKAIA